ncbi:MAG: hypothetical protein OEL55_03190, partial [Desulfobulbaceae bacterium]|nr:hypothetical protein [Desulfobulbaceae bacterium]
MREIALIGLRLLGLAFLLGSAGCVHSPPAMSLDEAKQYAASFQTNQVEMPPRNINDIRKVLEQSRAVDPQEIIRQQDLANQEPSTGMNDDQLASFYFKRGKAAHALGRAAQELHDYQLAVKYGEKSRFIYLDQALWFCGMAEKEGGNFSQAVASMTKAAKLTNKKGSQAIKYAVLARIHAKGGDLPTGRKYLAKAQHMLNMVLQHNRNLSPYQKAKIQAIIWSMKGTLLNVEGKAVEAETFHRKAIALFEPYKNANGGIEGADISRNNGSYTATLLILTENLIQQGKLVDAEITARKAVAFALSANGRYASNSIQAVDKLTTVLIAQGRFQEAEVLARANLDSIKKIGIEPYSLRYALAQMRIANALLAQKKWRQAISIYDQIKTDLISKDPESYQTRISNNINIALALNKAGRGQEALELVKPRLENLVAHSQERHYKVAEFRAAYGISLATIGQTREAMEQFQQAIPILIKKGMGQEGDIANTGKAVRLGFILEAYIDLLHAIRGTDYEKEMGIDAVNQSFMVADVLKRRGVQRSLAASAAR